MARTTGSRRRAFLGRSYSGGAVPNPLAPLGVSASAVSLALLALHPPTALVYVLVVLVGFGTAGAQNLINSYGGIAGPLFGGLLVAQGLTTSQNFRAFVVPAARPSSS